MATSSLKSQSLKKWVLLVFSLIAAVIWIRNLFVLLPREEVEVVSSGDESAPPSTRERAPVRPVAFDDTTDWADPFAPPAPKSELKQAGVQKKSPPKPPPEPPPWKLAGVVWDKKSPAAILASLSDDRCVVVAKGDTLGLARVEGIDQRNVWIRHDGRTWKLVLEDSDSSTSR